MSIAAAAAEMHGSGAINLRAFRNQQINNNLNLGSYQIVNSKFHALWATAYYIWNKKGQKIIEIFALSKY